jgi:hypothetical protein
MMPDGDTAAHLRKQVGGLFFYTPEVRGWRCFIEKMFSPPPLQDREKGSCAA